MSSRQTEIEIHPDMRHSTHLTPHTHTNTHTDRRTHTHTLFLTMPMWFQSLCWFAGGRLKLLPLVPPDVSLPLCLGLHGDSEPVRGGVGGTEQKSHTLLIKAGDTERECVCAWVCVNSLGMTQRKAHCCNKHNNFPSNQGFSQGESVCVWM